MSKRHREARQTQPMDAFGLLANHLRAFAQALADHIGQDLAAGSRGAIESEDRGWSGLGATRPALEAALLPRMLLGSAVDHLRGVAACVDADDVLYSILSLLRPMVEATAAAYFLLDPDITAEERVRRWANYRLDSLVESLRMVGTEGTGAIAGDSFAKDIESLTKRAVDVGFLVETDRPRPGFEPMRHLIPRTPSGMDLSRRLLDDLEGVDAGALVHRSTSAIIHGKLHGMLMLLRGEHAVPTADPAVSTVPAVMSLQAMASWIFPALWGIDRCARRACDHYGWSEPTWVTATGPVLLQWRQWVAA